MKYTIAALVAIIAAFFCFVAPVFADDAYYNYVPYGVFSPQTAGTWTELSDPWNDNYANQIWEIKTGPDGRLYVASNGGIAASADGGATWSSIGNLTDVTALAWNSLGEPVASSTETGSVVVYRYTGGQWVTTTGVTASLRVTEITNDSTGALVCSTAWGGDVFRSTDDGSTWTKVTGPWAGLGALWTIACGPDGTLYTGGELTTGLWASTDNGADWTNVGFTSAQGFTNNLFYVAFDENGAPLVASTQHNNGDPISRLVSGTPEDAGLGLPIYTNVHKMVVDPSGAITVGTVASTNTGNVYRSIDNGSSWSVLGSGYPGGGAEVVAEDASGSFYVDVDTGSGFAIYKLAGGGPTAPSNLSASALSSSQIQLTWQRNGSGETGFVVQRSLDDATWSTVANPAAGSTQYTDGSLASGTLYYYRVAALNDTWQTPYSNVASATTTGSGGTNATHFSVTAPSTATAGQSFSVTVTALTSGGSTAASYTGTVHFTSTDGSAVLPANVTLTNGVGTFTVTLNTVGNQTVTAADTVTSSITGTSNTIAVGSGATHFSVTAPSTAIVGQSFSVTVTALTAGGSTATKYNGTVHFTSTDGAVVLPANSTLTNGVGTFSVTLNTVGNQTVTATDTVTSSITGTSSSVAVGSGATHFSVTAPSTAIVGQSFSVTVTALTAGSSTATKYNGTVHFTSTDSAAQLPANSTLTNGVGTFTATLNTVGNQTVTATDTVTSSITGSTSPIAVGSGATHFSVSAPSTAISGQSFSFTVTALTAGGATATKYNGTVHFTSSDGSAQLPVNSTLTNGVGTFTATLNTVGNQTITGTDTVTSSITGTSGTIAVGSGATHFSVSAPSTATVGQSFSVTVTALTASGSTATKYNGTVHFTSTDGAAALPANSTLTNGVGSFSVTLNTTGNQTVTATDTVTASITGTSNTIAVSSGTTRFVISAPSTATVGQSFNLTVTAVNAGGGTATAYHGTVHFTSSDGAAQLPANATLTNGIGTFAATLNSVGNQTITATDTVTASLTGTSNTITVGSGATHFSVTAPASATAGQSFSFTVTALTAGGSTATKYSGTVHFTSTDGAAQLPANATLTNGVGTFTATLNTAASQTITATDTVTASITGTSNAISVSAATGGTAPTMFVFSAGLQMISAPADFTGLTLNQIFSPTGVMLATWVPANAQYVLSPTSPADTIRPGVGYWVRFTGSTTLFDLGQHTNPANPMNISLAAGWNMIGDPFATSVSIANLQIEDGSGNTMSFASAAQGGVVGANIYTFPAGATAYQVEQTALQPYAGYWVDALQPCTLIVPGS